jgi:Fe(3+) dicitrate transport protein
MSLSLRFGRLAAALFVSLFVGTPSFAQTGMISGLIVDGVTGVPLKGAHVQIHDMSLAVSTNERGLFTMGPIPVDLQEISVSYVGMQTVHRTVEVMEDAVIWLEIFLSEEAIRIPEVLVEQASMTGGLKGVANVPGSAHYIGPRDIQQFAHQDAHRVLRGVPGLNIQEEDGYGLRPNIGIRGSGAERSSKITIMEDGVPIAPAPYAASAAYYFPSIGRMSGVEVRKGSAQIKYGPATTGGAINLLSTPIPSRRMAKGQLTVGAEQTLLGHLSVGDQNGQVGWLLEGYRNSSDGFKQLDGGGDTGFGKSDLLGKVRWSSKPGARVYQSMTLKASLTEELSNETYLGLTDADFAEAPLRRYAASREDLMDASHRLFMARHRIKPSNNVEVITTAYHTRFNRNWYKLDKVFTPAEGKVSIGSLLNSPASYPDAYDVVSGSRFVSEHRLDVKANNRTYRVSGLQTDAIIGSGSRVLEAGVRLHKDEMDRFQWVDGWQLDDASMIRSVSGIPGTESNRVEQARALSAYLQPRISYGDVTFYPGVRVETIEQVRDDYGRNDVDRTGSDLGTRRNVSTALIPGMSASLQLQDSWNVFAGAHSGYAPPGTTEGAKPERSTNLEAGSRWSTDRSAVEVVAYINNYSNLLGADLAAGGGTGSTQLFNGGEARVSGLELSAQHNLGNLIGWSASIPVRVSYSWTEAVFESNFESSFNPWGSVNVGDRLPYVAPHQVFAALGVESSRFDVEISTSWVSTMRTVAGRDAPSKDSRIDQHFVVDLAAEFAINDRVQMFASVRNLTNEVYVAARRPAGVRPGLPRTTLLGLRTSF